MSERLRSEKLRAEKLVPATSTPGLRPLPLPLLAQVLERLRPERTETLLTDLIDIYSPCWGEQEVQELVFRYLDAHGARVEKQPVGERGRFNVIARTGEGPVGLLLLGHIDTVVKWYQGDHRARREGSVLRGLGSSDMKSGCAAMIEAFLSLSQVPDPVGAPSIALALVVGEEDEGDGIRALLEVMAPEVAVVGEPTSMRLCPAHYGYLEVLLTTHGRRAHSALPEIGRNAIEAMMAVITGLMGPLSNGDNASERPGLVCNLRELRGGGNAFVVPEYCEAVLDLHLPPEVTLARVKEEMRHRVRALASQHPQHHCQAKFKFGFNGYRLLESDPEIAPLLEACVDVSFQPKRDVFRSHSDANCLWHQGTRPIVIGPGDLTTAHTIDERVVLKELHQATQLYAAMGVRYRASRDARLRPER